MTLDWIGGQKHKKIAENYYYIMVFVYIVAIFVPSLRMGILMGLVLLMLFTRVSVRKRSNTIASLVYVFFVYNILSVQGYLYNHVPIRAYFEEAATQLFPMLFFFIAYNNRIDKSKFYLSFISAISIAIFVGFYFYLFPTARYVSYVERIAMGDYGAYVGSDYILRFQSLFGSIITGTFSVLLFVFSFYQWAKQKDKRVFKSIALLGASFFSVLSAFLSSQRSAMVMIIFSVIIMSYYIFKYNKSKTLSYILVIFLVVSFIMPLLMGDFFDYFSLWMDRLDSINTAVDGRSSQWTTTLGNSPNILLGTGLGSAGGHALEYTEYSIADGGLFKYLGEFGIVGMSVFLLIIIKALYKGYIYKKHLICELLVMIVCLAQSTGSNIICYQQVLPVFWFSIGVIACYTPVQKIKIETE